ncbi:small-subunit processome [Vararia minispora EC-137]|uniref:Small-subunit processome n=1 Tax=Vararia minispora EC-137 TaxID=1314806 RepID=A0ACB8QS17_9AGAM|nr:small-subunit processome [Vararia minispora EC-137]
MPLRNSLHRRNHKERSQLAHRERLGILEKHKDYVLRARDYHSKRDRLKRLAQKAADRNKDEFYFGMNRQRTERGVHVHERGNPVLPGDTIKVLKTQDENYVRTMRAAGLKKIEKLKVQLTEDVEFMAPGILDELEDDELQVLQEAGVIPGPSRTSKRSKKPTAKHIVFADDEVEAAALRGNSTLDDGTDATLSAGPSSMPDLGWKTLSTKGKKKAVMYAPDRNEEDVDHVDEERRDANRTRVLKELSARLHRDRMLRYAERELEMQRLLMGKGAATKIAGVEKVEEDEDEEEEEGGGPRRQKKADEKTYKPRVYKWRAERKR